MENKKVSVIAVLSSIILICIVIIGFQYLRIKQLEGNAISLAYGGSLPDLKLTPLSNSNHHKSKKIKLIFIFKSPCSSCNANLNTWKNFSRYFGDKVEVLGIILDGRMEAERLNDEQGVDFQLYLPENVASFKNKMHIKLNMAQTIIVSDDKVVSSHMGILSYQQIEEIMKRIDDILTEV